MNNNDNKLQQMVSGLMEYETPSLQELYVAPAIVQGTTLEEDHSDSGEGGEW